MSIQGPTVPILSGRKPYLGTDANKHAEYLSAANGIATQIDNIYTRMVGAERGGRENKPLVIRDAEGFEELKQSIKEAEQKLTIVLKVYKQGQFKDADDVINKAREKFYGMVQNEYIRLKARINRALNWEGQLSPYRKEQLEKSATLGEMQIKSDKQTMGGKEKYLFEF
jgi:hypothetical protein